MEFKKLEKLANIPQDCATPSDLYVASQEWFCVNRSKLSRYENNWIAVFNNELIGYSSNPYELEEKIKSKNLETNEVFIHFLADSNCIF